jgi:hypothetical protein
MSCKCPSSSDRTPVPGKMRGKKSAWGLNWLSVHGRMILVKPVLCALPLYLFSDLVAPRSVLQEAGKLMRTFLSQRGKSDSRAKIALAGWTCRKICHNLTWNLED